MHFKADDGGVEQVKVPKVFEFHDPGKLIGYGLELVLAKKGNL